MAKRISSSVGKSGKNKPEDTQIVQELLNDFAKTCGFKKLDVDGLIGPKTLAAVAAFQKKAVGMARPDSRIDPGGKSFEVLAKGAKKAEAEAKKAERAQKSDEQAKKGGAAKGDETQSQGSTESKPQVKGDVRGVDKKILGVLEAVSAHYGKPIVVEAGKQVASGGAEYLWHEWLDSLDRGEKDPNLKKDTKLRQQLDELYNQVKKREFMSLVAKNSRTFKSGSAGAHASGRAVDIKKNTNSKVLAALETLLRREDEGNVVHFDDTGKSIPKTISDSIKKKWK